MLSSSYFLKKVANNETHLSQFKQESNLLKGVTQFLEFFGRPESLCLRLPTREDGQPSLGDCLPEFPLLLSSPLYLCLYHQPECQILKLCNFYPPKLLSSIATLTRKWILAFSYTSSLMNIISNHAFYWERTYNERLEKLSIQFLMWEMDA